MIPKIIHYCWFGGKDLPKLALKCLESWKKFCPDYEIVRWDESNFDINACPYAKEAYDAGKFAFVSDYARLKVLVEHGGIYMDTDVEVLKPLDRFLEEKAFSGFESEEKIPTGIMACEKGFAPFAELLGGYDHRHFTLAGGGVCDLTTNVETITAFYIERGLIPNNTKQTIDGLTLYPKDFFCPKNWDTKQTKITSNTYTIHHFAGSWLPKPSLYVRFKRRVKGMLGQRITDRIISAKNLFRRLVTRLMLAMLKLLPLNENVIVFESEGDFSDNSFALYEHMMREGYFKKYRPVWFVYEPQKWKDRHGCTIISSRIYESRVHSVKFLYYLATSKYFFYDHCNLTARFGKRRGQLVFNLWHGAPFKSIKPGDHLYSGKEDFLSSPSDFWSEYLSLFCGTDIRKTVVTGYPRNDYFFRPVSENALRFAEKSGWRKFSKIIFWMPTFRKSRSKHLSEDYYKGSTGLPVIYSRDDMAEFNRFLQGINVIVVFKVHHLQMDSPIFGETFSNIMILNDEQIHENGLQLYEVLPLTDGLITDYSSICADYILLDKPMIFTMDDYEQYKASRGFLMENPADYWPGHHVFDKDGFFQAINDIANGKDNFRDARKKIMPLMHKYTDGNSSFRVLDVAGLKV